MAVPCFLRLKLASNGNTVYVSVNKIAYMAAQGSGTRLALAVSSSAAGGLVTTDVQETLSVIANLLQGQAAFVPSVT